MKITNAIGLIGLPRVEFMCDQRNEAGQLLQDLYSENVLETLCQRMKHTHQLYSWQ